MALAKRNGGTMTGADVRAARERLGLTVEQTAAELGAEVAAVSAWEAGARRVPREAASTMEMRLAFAERERILAESGLRPCEKAEEMDRAMLELEDDEFIPASEAARAHAESCHRCQRIARYLEEHAPPIPEPPMSVASRFIEGLGALPDRLPTPLRPPRGEAGDARRIAVIGAGFLSLLVVGKIVIAAALLLLSRGWEAGWWREPLVLLAAVVPAYFVGFYLAGWVVDATRRIRHRIDGYVLRGALGAAAVYGTVGLTMPLITSDAGFGDIPAITAIFATIGALAGAMLWIWHRIRRKLPARVT